LNFKLLEALPLRQQLHEVKQMDGPIPEAAPIACTLNTRSLEERLAWIANLNRRALLDASRGDLRLELTYGHAPSKMCASWYAASSFAAHSSTLIFVPTTTPSGSL
jgi:hypothetical protein